LIVGGIEMKLKHTAKYKKPASIIKREERKNGIPSSKHTISRQD
jgi:hypothetical protein